MASVCIRRSLRESPHNHPVGPEQLQSAVSVTVTVRVLALGVPQGKRREALLVPPHILLHAGYLDTFFNAALPSHGGLCNGWFCSLLSQQC